MPSETKVLVLGTLLFPVSQGPCHGSHGLFSFLESCQCFTVECQGLSVWGRDLLCSQGSGVRVHPPETLCLVVCVAGSVPGPEAENTISVQ